VGGRLQEPSPDYRYTHYADTISTSRRIIPFPLPSGLTSWCKYQLRGGQSVRHEVRVTETTKVTISLKPGQITEMVEISAQITSVETTNAATGQSLGTETVRELPLATQNYQQLLTL